MARLKECWMFLAILIVMGATPVMAATRGEIASIGIVTGPETGTYFAFGRDIAEVSRSVGQAVDVRGTSGSIENLKLMTKTGENAGLGIVQSDVLGFLRRSNNANSRQIADKLRLVFPFYKEEVHVLARKKFTSVQQLQGARVVIGEEGSGNSLTAINLFALLGIEPAKMLQLAPAEGVVAVLADDADAMIFVGGKPVPLFDNLADLKTVGGGKNAQLLEEIHFLPLNDPRVLKEYEAGELTSEDYPFIRETVPTIAVNAVLVAYDFSSGQNAYYLRRCSELAKIGHAIRAHLTYLKASGHPKWKQVDPSRTLSQWKRDLCAWREEDLAVSPQDSSGKPRFSTQLERDLLQVIRHGQGRPDTLTQP
ncbi:MAG: TAXI family TRAP transporter solute-binding subunit [Rickettsiales bacterium]|nr:TAXI family TRAP transporter solute-binding subunit [Rickettsiales bacterium]